MTKKNNGAKVLKATMIGTVALTPVLAVGLNVDKASAASNAEVTKLIDNLNSAFDNLTVPQQNLLRDAHSKIKGYLTPDQVDLETEKLLTAEVKGNESRLAAAEEVIGALVELLAASTTGYNMKAEFEKFNTVATDGKIKAAFNNQSLSNEIFIDYLVEVQNNLLLNMDGEGTYNAKLIKALKDTANSSPNSAVLTVAIWDTINVDNVGTTLDSIISGANILNAEKVAFKELAAKYKEVAKDDGDTTTPPPSGGGGVVIPPTPPTGDGAVEVDGSVIVINPQAVIDAIEKAAKVEELVITVQAGSTEVEIPATILAVLDKKNSDAVIVLQFGDVSYELPVNAFDLAEVAKDLDVASAELKLNVSVEKVDNPLASKTAYKVLSDAYDFNVSVVAPGGKSVALTVFPTPIKRSLEAAAKLNAATTVGVTVDANGKVTAVPTYVSGDTTANLYRSTNSVYTLIEHSKSFTDITKGTSWAEEYVDKLASRMVVNGKTQTTFAPTLKITRGEFAAILSRGLGIVAMDKAGNGFSDVSASQAFNKEGEIAAVVEAGIVAGYTDGTFRPYEEITRDQAAIMISRAIDYVGADKVTFDTKKALTAFKDSKEIGAASRKHVERVYQAGLLDGYLDDTFRPNADANRGQMAKIIYNFLAEIKFIN